MRTEIKLWVKNVSTKKIETLRQRPSFLSHNILTGLQQAFVTDLSFYCKKSLKVKMPLSWKAD